MAEITWYATNNKASVHKEMSETDPGTEATASPVTGWIVSTGSTNTSAMFDQVERAASTFVDTAHPNGSIDTTNGDCLRSANAYTGTFDGGAFNLYFCCRATTNGGAQDGFARARLFKGAAADGSDAVEITSAAADGSQITDLTTTATQESQVILSFVPILEFSGEYVFVEIAWQRNGAGGMTSSDVNMRIGNASGTGTRVVSTNFTPVLPTSFLYDRFAAMRPHLVRRVREFFSSLIPPKLAPLRPLARLLDVLRATNSAARHAPANESIFRKAA